MKKKIEKGCHIVTSNPPEAALEFSDDFRLIESLVEANEYAEESSIQYNKSYYVYELKLKVINVINPITK